MAASVRPRGGQPRPRTPRSRTKASISAATSAAWLSSCIACSPPATATNRALRHPRGEVLAGAGVLGAIGVAGEDQRRRLDLLHPVHHHRVVLQVQLRRLHRHAEAVRVAARALVPLFTLLRVAVAGPGVQHDDAAGDTGPCRGVRESEVAAERVTDEHRRTVERRERLVEVGQRAVAGVLRRILWHRRLPVAEQVDRADAVAVGEQGAHAVPRRRRRAHAMEEHEGRAGACAIEVEPHGPERRRRRADVTSPLGGRQPQPRGAQPAHELAALHELRAQLEHLVADSPRARRSGRPGSRGAGSLPGRRTRAARRGSCRSRGATTAARGTTTAARRSAPPCAPTDARRLRHGLSARHAERDERRRSVQPWAMPPRSSADERTARPWAALGGDDATADDLVARHREPHRRYHTVDARHVGAACASRSSSPTRRSPTRTRCGSRRCSTTRSTTRAPPTTSRAARELAAAARPRRLGWPTDAVPRTSRTPGARHDDARAGGRRRGGAARRRPGDPRRRGRRRTTAYVTAVRAEYAHVDDRLARRPFSGAARLPRPAADLSPRRRCATARETPGAGQPGERSWRAAELAGQ